MKIESLLIRKGGTKVHFGPHGEPQTEYHFKPDDKGRHVAEVADADHISKLLAIPDAYRLVLDEPQAGQSGEPAPNQSHTGGEQTGDGLEAMDRIALSELFKTRYGTPPQAALSKAKIIEALRQPEA